MNNLTLVANENGKLIFSTKLEEVFSKENIPLAAYLEGNFNLAQILELMNFPLIYADPQSLFDFTGLKDLFEKELPTNFSLLVKRIGYANSLELFLSNKIHKAEELCFLRLINQISTKEEFEENIKHLSKLSLSAIETALDLTSRATYLANAQAEILEKYVFALRFAHSDQKEGMQAFLEKRLPNFSK